jgi:hypothetical protein
VCQVACRKSRVEMFFFEQRMCCSISLFTVLGNLTAYLPVLVGAGGGSTLRVDCTVPSGLVEVGAAARSIASERAVIYVLELGQMLPFVLLSTAGVGELRSVDDSELSLSDWSI